MNLYPAIKFHMGSWDYYAVKMNMRELAESVKFGSEVHEDRTLDEAIQRSLKESRVNKDIVTYLKRQPNRFFSSVVVAAIEGDPKFYPVLITGDERFEVFADDPRLNQSFGVLKFDGRQNYYALDGQHRLAAIKRLLDKNDPLSDGSPEGFKDDEISVLVVVPKPRESQESFLQKYRRLFSNLNRYAKPMDQATNIIMDEDDTFAILTRRLITEHDFFKWSGRQKESPRVKTDSKNMKSTDPQFTSLETLYDMNTALLFSHARQNKGWGPDEDEGEQLGTFKKYRPEEEYLDSLYEELVLYWDGLLDEIPDLSRDPTTMRNHSWDPESDDSDTTDHLLFWPIGQQMLAELARDLLDARQPKPAKPELASVKAALDGLGNLEWRLHLPPWRYFLLTLDPSKDSWRMRSEDRTEAVRIGKRIQKWVIGLDELDSDELEELQMDWANRLIPNQSEGEDQRLWSQVKAQKSGKKKKSTVKKAARRRTPLKKSAAKKPGSKTKR